VALGARVGLLAAGAIADVACDLVHRTIHVGGCAARTYDPRWRSGVAASHLGVVRWRRIDAEPRAEVGFVALGEGGRIDVVDATGASIESFSVEKGDYIAVPDGGAVSRGTCVVYRPWFGRAIVADFPRGGTATAHHVLARDVVDDVTGIESRIASAVELQVRLEDGRIPLTVPLPDRARLEVWDGAEVLRGDVLALDWSSPEPGRGAEFRTGLSGLLELLDAARPSDRALVASADGVIHVVEGGESPRLLRLDPSDGTSPRMFCVRLGTWALVRDGESVSAGEALTYGTRDHRDLVRALGPRRFADYLLGELVALLGDANVACAEQHLELIVREMLRSGGRRGTPRVSGIRELARHHGYNPSRWIDDPR
jgi:hypothetical protein